MKINLLLCKVINFVHNGNLKGLIKFQWMLAYCYENCEYISHNSHIFHNFVVSFLKNTNAIL